MFDALNVTCIVRPTPIVPTVPSVPPIIVPPIIVPPTIVISSSIPSVLKECFDPSFNYTRMSP